MMTIDAVLSWTDHPDPETFPYDEVIDAFLEVGKHFVAEELLTALVKARDRLRERESPPGEHDDLLARFLDVALDKWDGTYHYPSYVALPILPLPSIDDPPAVLGSSMARRDWLLAQLVADLVDFELAAAHGRTALLPQARPEPSSLAKRYRRAITPITASIERLGLAVDTSAAPEEAARQLCAAVAGRQTAEERRLLRLSMLPVYTSHDEYLFIRCLQLFELSFAVLALQVRAAIDALDTDAAEGAGAAGIGAAAHIRAAESVLREAAPFFSLLATMQVESFRVFRQYTEGASAIQSRNYKTVESLCRAPDAERLDSPAYESVPEVRERVLAGPVTLDAAFEAARASGRLPGAELDELTAAMAEFAKSLRRWRQTHYRLAVRMLGDRSGTGYTEGTPYLRAVRHIPVFQSVDETQEGSDGGD